MKRYLSLEDLYTFCLKNNFSHFSAAEAGGPIVVHSLGLFNANVQENSDLSSVTLQACHTELNNNKSFISEKTMTKALPTFSNKPILGYIHQLDDGSWDFYTHNISYVEDEESEDGIRTQYDERVIGIVPESCKARLEYDEEHNKTYVVVDGYIYNLYGNRAIEIIKNNGGKSTVSVEIEVREMTFNADKGYLEIEDMAFLGVTCLGKTPSGAEVLPGMEGANLKLDNFSATNNSMFNANYQDKLIETLEKLNNTLSSFNINNNMDQEEVSEEMGHFDELLAKYGVELEAIDFEYEGLNDEELDAIFEEKFGSSEEVVVEEEFEEGSEEELTDEQEEEVVITEEQELDEDEEHEEEHSEEFSFEDVVISFKISHEDVRYGIQNLLNAMNNETSYYVVHSVYDGFFYYEDWMNSNAFKQNYKMRKDVISFNGDPIPVFREFVTQEEKDELEGMRKNYALLKEFKDNYDAAELKAKKDEIFGRKEFKALENNEEFKTLKDNMDSFTVEEIESQAKQIFADHVIANGQFALENIEEPEQKPAKIGFNFANKSKKAQAYSGLFDE